MDPKIISDGIKPDILRLLHLGEFETVLAALGQRQKGILNFKSKPKKEAHFAYGILPSLLNKKLKPNEYDEISKLDFTTDFLKELIEIFRFLLILEDYSKEPEIEKLTALTLLACIRNGAVYIGENSNNYPHNSINGKIWMDGAGLRTRADELSAYFRNKNDDESTLQAIFLRSKITNTIMGHYPNLVGPDMVAVGLQCEKMGKNATAQQFLNAVVLDFTRLVQEVKEDMLNPEFVARDEEIPITESLVHALEGLKRLGEEINEDTLVEAKEVLKELKKASNIH